MLETSAELKGTAALVINLYGSVATSTAFHTAQPFDACNHAALFFNAPLIHSEISLF